MPKKFETIVVELFPSWLNILFSSEKTHGCSLQIAFKFLINHCWTVSFWSHVMIKWTGWMDVVHISLNLPRRGCPWVFAWRRTFSLNALKKMQGSLSSIQGLTVRRVCCWNACVQTSVVGRVFFRHFSKYELIFERKGHPRRGYFQPWSSLSRMVWIIWQSNSFQLGRWAFHVSGKWFSVWGRGYWLRKMFDWHWTLN